MLILNGTTANHLPHVLMYRAESTQNPAADLHGIQKETESTKVVFSYKVNIPFFFYSSQTTPSSRNSTPINNFGLRDKRKIINDIYRGGTERLGRPEPNR
jgi:hypothetical protein